MNSTRIWLIGQYVGVYAFFVGPVLLTVLGAEFLVAVGFAVAVVVVMTVLFAPNRSWWGSGPAQILADPASLRRYRVRGLMVLGLVVLTVVVGVPVLAVLSRG